MFLNDKLKIARTACGYTQQQVADIIGIDRSSYAYYESGKCLPSPENTVKLAALFKTDINWLMGVKEDVVFLSAPEDIFSVRRSINESGLLQLSDDEKEIIGLYRMLKGTADNDKLVEALRKFESENAEDHDE